MIDFAAAAEAPTQEIHTQYSIAKVLQSNRHSRDCWMWYEDLRTGTGYGESCEQSIDVWTMSAWPSHNYERIAYEIKVSRSDFLREIKQPNKRALALLYSNKFYFVAPQGILKPADMPPEAGLVEIQEGRAFVTVSAPWRDTPPPSWRFLASVARQSRKRGMA